MRWCGKQAGEEDSEIGKCLFNVNEIIACRNKWNTEDGKANRCEREMKRE